MTAAYALAFLRCWRLGELKNVVAVEELSASVRPFPSARSVNAMSLMASNRAETESSSLSSLNVAGVGGTQSLSLPPSLMGFREVRFCRGALQLREPKVHAGRKEELEVGLLTTYD